jgi:hypothetical protein
MTAALTLTPILCLTKLFLFDRIELVRIEFTQASRKHRIGREHVRHVMATTVPSPVLTNRGAEGWQYVGRDDRGVMLEVIAVETDAEEPTLLVIHAMPYTYRERT